MVLFVDETECVDFFIVAGLLVDSKDIINFIYKKFKNKLKGMKLSDKAKQQIYLEFKAVLLDKHYQKIKSKMIQELNNIDYSIIYSCYIKKDKTFNQRQKEEQYIYLLKNIILSIDEDIHIIFDTFNKNDFELNIINNISKCNNVLSIKSEDSRKEPGLQFVDNICSAIRLYKRNVNVDFYMMLKNHIDEV
ncbi:MAG: DUF3800 domain-containing protein [Erysipelotrichaceae bacterium]|nr:DUF3800 domain-containing protein [Erysipelotrichaceae bacterium]